MKILLKTKFYFLSSIIFFYVFINCTQHVLAQNHKEDIEQKENIQIIKQVEGLSGIPLALALRWINKQKDFLLVEFKPGNNGVYLNNGTLLGKTKTGTIIKISIPSDFTSDNPGMILDHLTALRSRLDSLKLSRKELKKNLIRNAKLKRDWAKNKQKNEEKIKKAINTKMEEIFKKELTIEEKSVIASLKQKLDPIVRESITLAIKQEVFKEFPHAELKKIDKETSKRIDKELNLRVAKKIRRMVLNESFGNDQDFKEARKIVHKVLIKNKPKIEAEVRIKFQTKERDQYIKLKNEILYGITTDKENASIVSRLKAWFTKVFE